MVDVTQYEIQYDTQDKQKTSWFYWFCWPCILVMLYLFLWSVIYMLYNGVNGLILSTLLFLFLGLDIRKNQLDELDRINRYR